MPEFECLRMPVHLEVPDGRFALAGLLHRDGILALQLHAGAPMWTEFKNIRFREIK